ncbi:MAG: hypothetical protein LBN07_01515 [Christensenellaceae bacterium]|jgi:hypothetical protein|nr:hypothetical protein [Christensenellaceae bacterium]
MARNAIEFPHPVLNEYLKDYVDCGFSIAITDCTDNTGNIEIGVKYELSCVGLEELIKDGKAEVVLRVISGATLFRKAYIFGQKQEIIVSINKKELSGNIEVSAYIVAKTNIDNFLLKEHNNAYFHEKAFKIKKSDILADVPGIFIPLESELEKQISSIIIIDLVKEISKTEIKFSNSTDDDSDGLIHIRLPEAEYTEYHTIRSRFAKLGIKRFLQNALMLPAIIEAIDLLKYELTVTDEDTDRTSYKGTVWADSILANLKKLEIDLEDNNIPSSVKLANELLGNVIKDSIQDLSLKMKEWSNVTEESRIGGID